MWFHSHQLARAKGAETSDCRRRRYRFLCGVIRRALGSNIQCWLPIVPLLLCSSAPLLLCPPLPPSAPLSPSGVWSYPAPCLRRGLACASRVVGVQPGKRQQWCEGQQPRGWRRRRRLRRRRRRRKRGRDEWSYRAKVPVGRGFPGNGGDRRGGEKGPEGEAKPVVAACATEATIGAVRRFNGGRSPGGSGSAAVYNSIK